MRVIILTAAVALLFSTKAFAGPTDTPRLALPMDCSLGEDCFLQQMPDMDESESHIDPFCNGASYDGHKGTDIRLRYFNDVNENVPVVASAKGEVARLRDGIDDRLMKTAEDRARVANKECGNGVVIDHGGGWQTQYCHLKKGSLRVKEGDAIKAGDVIGAVGSSGMSGFPHIDFTLRKNGQVVDPFSGNLLESGCTKSGMKNTLWEDRDIVKFGKHSTQILDLGFAGNPVKHDALAIQKPKTPNANSTAMVGWASLINLKKGDVMLAEIMGPDGSVFASNTSDPLDRNKAAYLLFTGKRGAPDGGMYKLKVQVLRDNKVVVEAENYIDI